MRLSGHISTYYKQTLEGFGPSFYPFSQLDDWQCTSLVRLISLPSTVTRSEPPNTFTQITKGCSILSHTWGSRLVSAHKSEVSGKKGKTISTQGTKRQQACWDRVGKCEGSLNSRIFPNPQVSTSPSLYLCLQFQEDRTNDHQLLQALPWLCVIAWVTKDGMTADARFSPWELVRNLGLSHCQPSFFCTTHHRADLCYITLETWYWGNFVTLCMCVCVLN